MQTYGVDEREARAIGSAGGPGSALRRAGRGALGCPQGIVFGIKPNGIEECLLGKFSHLRSFEARGIFIAAQAFEQQNSNLLEFAPAPFSQRAVEPYDIELRGILDHRKYLGPYVFADNRSPKR